LLVGLAEKRTGKVIIQTYNPDNYAIMYSKKQDYDLFYKTEIDLRKKLNYPPFCDIILIRFNGKNIDEIERVSNKVYKKLMSFKTKDMWVYKPVPSPIDKIKNKYRWRIVVKCKLNSKMLDIIKLCIDEKVKDTSIIVDINPGNMT